MSAQHRLWFPPLVLSLVLIAVVGGPPAQAAAGDLDPTFGTGGQVTTDFGNSFDYGRAVAIQSDGKIVVAGYRNTYTSHNVIALARYTSGGALDPTFGSGGRVLSRIGSSGDNTVAIAEAIQGDDKIVVVGEWMHNSHDYFAVVRFNANGSLDSTFGSGGKVVTAVGSIADFADAVSVQSDGKIVVAGDSYQGSGNIDFAVVRYMPTGALDPTFGTNGKVVTAFGRSYDEPNAMAIQSDGKIVLAGYTTNLNQSKFWFALARYTSSGSLDPTFGTGGRVVSAIGPTVEAFAFGVAIQTDGDIVAAGQSYNGTGNDFALARYSPLGVLDGTFGSGGSVTTTIGGNARASAVLVQSDGKIVAIGVTGTTTHSDFAVARYRTSGALDSTFGSGGIVTTDFASQNDAALAGAIQSDGKIVAAGFTESPPYPDFAVARYLAS